MSGKSGLSKRQRAKVFRISQYVLLVAVVVVFAITADWAEIRRAFFDFDVAAQQFPNVITIALKNTIIYTVLGFAFGLSLGLILALMRLSSVAPYRWLSTIYIEFFRGLPALLVFIAIGTGIPLAFKDTHITREVSIMLALGLVGAAYMAETIRAGIQAVPKGQVEAARSLGMSQGRAMITIVIPQAFRIILPPLTNELILLTKDSSLAYLLGSTLAEQELAQFGRQALTSFKSLTPVLVVGLCYLIITIPLSLLSRRLENKFGSGGMTTRGVGG
ncbi:amino acid ABC transporter permease [Allokutzneria sp. A3M-2-11 16]|uniref:amino acid ABC transporter permease n=1 Tax=Allokutzneria sp. A3M-2-11 16 TaxID=2962043 RepID=UPI0020B80FAE|nr:amino acid ABC transporter permease [Allokutzneria sp. A3M-2-11 16]MCP3799375.1 amino acid ABC transporter permease [Allokutzneria sp. A3M-2-11 16]